ncbi:hypothetical protein EYC84_010688 [Monilinia fructicola]|uniref:Pectate lyase domain-containing protein n=1 Tax=Monilinia fructicola TaxID=38448 RepID=A0A5M9J604_MONFR|nr:hypothetical protein EYC84_010688 [Monilinia fructicola]
MKLSILSTGLVLLAQFASAAPTPTENEDIVERANVAKRASITDIATTGYATQNGGTTGGKGGATTTVSTLAQFTDAVTNDAVARVIVVSGTITGSVKVRVGSNKTIVGKKGATLVGVGLYINKSANVIVRNIISQKVLAGNGDAIGVQASTNVWIDHVDVSSDLSHGKDYYDGLIDITHASDWVTVSNSYLHEHYKASLIGHSDSNGAEDTGHLTVTQHNNYWSNIGSRTPSLRFGTGHVYNSYFLNAKHRHRYTRWRADPGAEQRLQECERAHRGTLQRRYRVCISAPIFLATLYPSRAPPPASRKLTPRAPDSQTHLIIDLGGYADTAPVGTLTASSVPYSYSLLGSGNVVAAVVGTAGATLDL